MAALGRLGVCLLVAALLPGPATCGAAAAQDAPAAEAVRTLRSATAVLEPEGRPSRTGELPLPFRWDSEFPGLGGRATYRLTLPGLPDAGAEPQALLIEGAGNQIEIKVDDATVAHLGTLGDPRYDAAKATHLVALPAAGTAAPRQLLVVATVQRQRGAGLGVVRVGAERQLARIHDARQRWSGTAAVVYVAGLLLMGGLAAGLWLRQRDELYGCFSLAAFTGVVRNLDRAWPDVPMAWPWWGVVVAVSYAVHIALIARFVLLVLDRRRTGLMRALDVVLVAAVILACASFLFAVPWLWTAALVGLLASAMACLPSVVRDAFVDRAPVAWALVAAGSLAIAAGLHDLLLVRMGLFGGAGYTLTPHSVFAFVLILAGLVVERYSRTVIDYRQLNANLAAQVAQRETQLRDAFELVRTQQQEQAVLIERQRMMREIHDGVGSQLVGLLNVVNQPAPDPAVLEEHAKLALDEMRMAVDSLQPGHDDLGTVLATLRYRLQGRLDAAGIELHWDVEHMPTVPVTAHDALQFQRIVLEAFTNVLKHARAGRIEVRAGSDARGSGVRIEIADDGAGLSGDADAAAPRGQGLANMRWRAQAIGATLDVAAALPRGTRVLLEWPAPGERESAA